MRRHTPVPGILARRTILYVLTIAVGLASAGCVSRYRLTIRASLENRVQNLKVLTSEYFMDARLGAYPDETTLLPADGGVMLITFLAFSERVEEREQVLKFDESIRYRTYIQLPRTVKPGTIPLEGSSIVELVGRYAEDRSVKLYRPHAGRIIIDSISGSRVYATLAAEYRNVEGTRLAISGQFKARIQ